MLGSVLKSTKVFLITLFIIMASVFMPSCSKDTNNSANMVYRQECDTLKLLNLYDSYFDISKNQDKDYNLILNSRSTDLSSLFSVDTLVPAVSIIKLRFYALFFSLFSILLYITNFISGLLFGRYLHKKAVKDFNFMPKLRLALMCLSLIAIGLCSYLLIQTSFAAIVYLVLLVPLVPFLVGAKIGSLFFNIMTR